MKEELRSLLEEEHSKAQTLRIARLVEEHNWNVEPLVEISLENSAVLPQRASWVLDVLTQKNEGCINPYVEEISIRLSDLPHSGTRRNLCKLLSRSELPEKNLGHLLDTSFKWLESRETAVAVRVHCMEIVYRICLLEPGLIDEFKMVLEGFAQTGTGGEKSRARNILKRYN